MPQPRFDAFQEPSGPDLDSLADALARAEHFNAIGRHDLAEREARAGLAQAPRDAELLVELSVSLDGLGRCEAASQAAREAVAADPEHAPALYQLAALLVERGSHREAEELFLQALRDDPEFPPGIAAYGWLMLKTGRLRKSRDLAQHALRLDPNCASAHQLLSLVLGEGRGKSAALSHAAASLQLEADDDSGHAVMGVAALRAGRPFRARRHLREALQRAPADRDHEEAYLEADQCCRWLYLPYYYATVVAEKLPGGLLGLWAIWMSTIFLLVFAGAPGPVVGALGIGWFVFCFYTWIAGPLVRLWVKLVPPR